MSTIQQRGLLLFAVLSGAALFAADVTLPQGIELCAGYVLLILLGWWLPKFSHIVFLASYFSLLIAADYFVLAEGGNLLVAQASHLFAFAAVWIGAGLLFRMRGHWQAREDSHRQLQGILNFSPLSVSLKDKHGIYKRVTRHHEKVMNVTQKEVEGKTVYDIYEPSIAKIVDDLDHRVLEKGEIIKNEEIVINFGGMRRHFLATKFPLLDASGKPEEVCSVHVEITELVRNRERLRNTYSLLHGMADALPALISYVDTNQVYRFVNKAYEDWFGLSNSVFLGNRIGDVLGAANYGLLKPHLDIAFAGRRERFETTLVSKVKGLRHLEITYTPDFGEDGKVHGLFILVLDITERKRNEVALLHTKKEADRANEAKTRFLAAASHDLRQPLQAAALFSYLLSERELDAKSRELIAGLRGSLKASSDELDMLLDISKLEEGAIDPDITEFPIGSLLLRLEEGFAAEARDKEIALRILPSKAVIRSDVNLLHAALRNLLSNAIKYTPPGGRVLVGCRHRGRKLRFEVLDTGPGIEKENQEKIFEEFYQLENTHRDRKQGVGLGLAIVKRSADLLQHAVGVTSSPGRGSCFYIEMPIAMGDAAQSKEGNGRQAVETVLAVSFTGAEVLLIEDDPIVCEAITLFLEEWNCHVTSAISVEQARGLLSKLRIVPDCILADYRLPRGISGLEAAPALEKTIGKKVPCLLLTGDSSGKVDLEAAARGLPLLRKPVSPKALLEGLEALLAEKAV